MGNAQNDKRNHKIDAIRQENVNGEDNYILTFVIYTRRCFLQPRANADEKDKFIPTLIKCLVRKQH